MEVKLRVRGGLGVPLINDSEHMPRRAPNLCLSWKGDMNTGLFQFCPKEQGSHRALFLTLLLALALAGCLRQPSPQGPQEPPPHPHESRESAVLKEDPVPASPRLTLGKAVEEAIKASPELEQVQHRIDAASQQIKQVEATFFPRILFAEEFNATDNPVYALMYIINQRRLQPTVNFNDPGTQRNFSSRIQAELSLFEGGSRWHERGAAVSGRRSLEADLMSARNRLVAKVAETYYRWLQAVTFISVAEEALEAARTDENLGEARFRVEMALPGDVARLKARTAEMQGNLVSARSNGRRLQAAMERLVARPIGPEELPDPHGFTAGSTSGPELPADQDSLVKQALVNRPEVAAARAMVEAAFQRVKSAQGAFLPKLSASGQIQWDSEDLGKQTDSWLVGIHASLPLFEGGLTLARLNEARARLKEMQARGGQVELDIALEVRQAALALGEAFEKIKVQEERRNWALKALEEVRHQYRAETAGVDSLLQAQLAWTQAQVAYTAALFEGSIARALLKQSLGDLAEGIL